MIKYRTSQNNSAEIKEFVVERETDSSLWIGGRRAAKSSTYWVFHDSWDKAKAFLLSRAEQKLHCARSALQCAQDELGNIKGLKEPK